MLEVIGPAIKAASQVDACAGMTLESGLQADPCRLCLRRTVYALIGTPIPAAVRWIESDNLVGYVCKNQVKGPAV